jgi:flagellum-specific peptidoglycan hydrolase FlgJ
MLFSTIALESLLGTATKAKQAIINNPRINTNLRSLTGNSNQSTASKTLTPVDTSSVEINQDVADKAQAFIDKYRMKNDLPALITGKDVALASQKYNIDPKLILAQGLNETHFGTNPAAKRAQKYNSAFGMGSFDDGSQRMTFKDGTDATLQYAKLLRNEYLGDKDSLSLLDNYVNLKGKRYASDKNYETKLKSTIEKIKKFGL